MEEIKRLASLDRIEEGRLVFYTDDDLLYTLSAADFPALRAGDRVELTVADSKAVSAVRLEEQTEQAKQKTRSLFSAILRKKR